MKCHECIYSVPRGYQFFECRRRAPIAEKVEHSVDLRGFIPIWPIVKLDDWCGDFVKREIE